MAITPRPSDRTVLAVAIWAWAGVSLAVPLGLAGAILGVSVPLWLDPGPDRVAWAASVGMSLAISALIGLYLYAAVRCVARSTREVFRGWTYPPRHWAVARKAVVWTLRVDLTLGAIALALITLAIRIPTRGDGLAAFASIAAALFLFFQVPAVFGMNDVLRHVTVVPYFERKVGEIETFAQGEALARNVGALDDLARAAGVTPLSDFGWDDDRAGETVVWHDPADGLRTVSTLLGRVEADGLGPNTDRDRDGLIADLKRHVHALTRATDRAIPFCLLLRHSTATNGLEWDARLGTCF